MPRAPSKVGPFHDTQLAINLRRLITQTPHGSVNAFARQYNLNQTSINRAANGTNDVTVGTLTEWAKAIGCTPAQLLRADFDPSRIGTVIGDPRQRKVAELFGKLASEADCELVEALLARLIETGPAARDTVVVPTKAARPAKR